MIKIKDNQIREVQQALKKLGCGTVELDENFRITTIEGDLLSKEKIIHHERNDSTNFIAVAKSPYGSVVLGKDESLDFFKATVQLMKIVFSTPINKRLKRILIFIVKKIIGKKLKR